MASQANNLTLINLILAVLAVLGVIGWSVFVKHRAEKMAKESAEAWMDVNAPGIIAEIQANLSFPPPSPGGGADSQGDALAADEGTKK